MKRKDYEYIGDLSQLFRVETYRLEGGRKDGVRATSVTNAQGLSFTVVADRCMDISHLSYKGVNVSYINPCGVVAPQYYEGTGTNWLKSFTGGMMVTCGLDNVGSPCTEEEELGFHGRIGNTPAEEYCVKTIQAQEENRVEISGLMRQSFIFGKKLWLRRKITAYQERNCVEIEDEISNVGFEKQEYMQLYHCNIGYPFLSPGCELLFPSKAVTGANIYSEENLDQWNQITEPEKVGEMCFLHELENRNGHSCVGMFNHKLQMGFMLWFENHDLARFLQWRYLNRGEYVIGLEPATNYAGGKTKEKQENRIKCLKAGENVTHRLKFEFFDSLDKLKNAMESSETIIKAGLS